MGHLGAVGTAGEVYGFRTPPSMTSFLVLAALASDPAPPLAAEGERLGGARVERVELHPEYQRYALRFDDGTVLVAEVTFSRLGHEGLCAAGGVTLFPRPELTQGPEPADTRAEVDALCARLVARPPSLAARQEHYSPREATRPEQIDLPVQGPPLLVPLMAVVAVMLGLAGWVAARTLPPALRALAPGERRELALVGVVGLAARLGCSPRGLFNAEGAAYEKLTYAWGLSQSNPYGEGFNALYAVPLWLLGRSPEALFALNVAVSAVLPPLGWALGRRLAGRGDPRTAALATGLVLALLPLAVRLAATELMHVPVATLVGLALVVALAQHGRSDPPLALLAALAMGVAAHTRVEVAPAALVVAGLLGTGRGIGRAGGLVTLVGLLTWRYSTLPESQGVLSFERLAEPPTWLALARPRLDLSRQQDATVSFLTVLTPPVLWAFALAGLAGLRARVWPWALLTWVTLELPVTLKAWPLADAMRLQLPSQLGWAALVGVGAGLLASAWPRLPRWPAWLLGAVLLLRLVTHGPGPLWPHHHEYHLLATTVPELPPDGVVLYPDVLQRSPKFARVMRQLGPARWVGTAALLAGADVRPTLYFRSVDCHREVGREACAAVESRCTIEPWRVLRVGPPTDLDVTLPAAGVEIGFWRVLGCGR